MKALSKLEVLGGAITVAAMAVMPLVLGLPDTPAQFGIQFLCAFGLGLLGALALPWVLPGARRADSAWRAPLSDAAGKRIMGTVLRAPFYLAALFFAIVVTIGYLRHS